MRRRSILLTAALAAVVLPSGARASAPSVQLARLTSGTAILQAQPGRLGALRARLTALGTRQAVFPHLAMVAVRGTAAALRTDASQADVRYAHMDQHLRFFDEKSTPLVYDGTQQSVWSGGFDGRGVRVAIVDSGVDGLHPDLQNRVARNVKFVEDIFTNQPAVAVDCPTACTTDTSSGHGSHVAGIVAGDGTASSGRQTGVAPGADLVGYSTGDGDSIIWSLAAFNVILAHPELNIRAVNNSWGPANAGGSLRVDLTDPIHQATKELHDAGVTVVFAAGNDGSGSNAHRPQGAAKGDQAPPRDRKINGDSVAPGGGPLPAR